MTRWLVAGATGLAVCLAVTGLVASRMATRPASAATDAGVTAADLSDDAARVPAAPVALAAADPPAAAVTAVAAVAAIDPVPSQAVPAVMTDKAADLRPFLARYCYECHGPDKQEQDLRFDTLGHDLADVETLRTWQDILDQVSLGEMPPPKKQQPAASELTPFVEVLTARLEAAYAQNKSTGGSTVLRRLNRAELRNTLRDLLYLQGPDYRSPTVGPEIVDAQGSGAVINVATGVERDFPEDEKQQGFDTIGQKLMMSDFLLALTVGAAEDALGRATTEGDKPSTEPRRFASPIRGEPRGPLAPIAHKLNPGYDGIFEIYMQPDSGLNDEGRVSPAALYGTGVGVSARYRITVEASAHNHEHQLGKLIDIPLDEPMMLGLHVADVRKRPGYSGGSPADMPVVQWPMTADGKTKTFVHELYLNSTWTAWLGWENGPQARAFRPVEIVEQALPGAFRPRPPNEAPEQEKQEYQADMVKALFDADGYMGPHLRIHSITFEPLIDQWPPRSHTLLYGTTGSESPADLLLEFARRAYRGPVLPADVDDYVKLVEAQLEKGLPRAEALRMGYAAILVAPRFLYVHETAGPLDGYQLASRLSYFLWSSMPDEELFALAADGTIKDPAVLHAQVERMLNHENAAAFTRRFVTSWLRLDKLGAMAPDRSGPYRYYFDRHLWPLMADETDAYFADLLKHNGPIRDLIDSDYTFMDERLAQHCYNISDGFHQPDSTDYYPKYVRGAFMRKVKLKDSRRGGVLTHPSVLTATANGVDTSPVIRGVWILESILGTPPSPPPPDVPALSPDLRAATTIREQLDAHRKNEACNSCHQKIDPMGFAFENFNPIGRWRDTYPGSDKKIDPSAELPNGEPVADIVALRKYLLTREEQVTRNLCEKLISYATGRMIEPTDRSEVERIVRQLREKNGGLRDLVDLVVQSKPFATK